MSMEFCSFAKCKKIHTQKILFHFLFGETKTFSFMIRFEFLVIFLIIEGEAFSFVTVCVLFGSIGESTCVYLLINGNERPEDAFDLHQILSNCKKNKRPSVQPIKIEFRDFFPRITSSGPPSLLGNFSLMPRVVATTCPVFLRWAPYGGWGGCRDQHRWAGAEVDRN